MNLYGTPNTIGTILQCIVLYHYWAGKKGTAQPFTPRSVTIPLQWQFSQGLCSDAFMLLFYIHVWYSIQQLQNTKLLSRNRDKYTVSESLKHMLLRINLVQSKNKDSVKFCVHLCRKKGHTFTSARPMVTTVPTNQLASLNPVYTATTQPSY